MAPCRLQPRRARSRTGSVVGTVGGGGGAADVDPEGKVSRYYGVLSSLDSEPAHNMQVIWSEVVSRRCLGRSSKVS